MRWGVLASLLFVAACGRVAFDDEIAVAGESGPLIALTDGTKPIGPIDLTGSTTEPAFVAIWVEQPTGLPNELRAARFVAGAAEPDTTRVLEQAVDAKWTRIAATPTGFLLLCPSGDDGYLTVTLDLDGAKVSTTSYGDPRYYGNGWLVPGPSGLFGLFSHTFPMPEQPVALFQSIDVTGVPQGASMRLDTSSTKQMVTRGVWTGRRWIAVWRDASAAVTRIRIVTVDADGTAGEARTLHDSTPAQDAPIVFADGAGGAIASFTEEGRRLFVRLDAMGAAKWPEPRELLAAEAPTEVDGASVRGLAALAWRDAAGAIRFATLDANDGLSEARTLSPDGATACEGVQIAATGSAFGTAFRCANQLWARTIAVE